MTDDVEVDCDDNNDNINDANNDDIYDDNNDDNNYDYNLQSIDFQCWFPKPLQSLCNLNIISTLLSTKVVECLQYISDFQFFTLNVQSQYNLKLIFNILKSLLIIVNNHQQLQ